jgi:mannose-1-phosphate guanylyltransferase
MGAFEARAPRALLLTAGLGTRLQPLTYQRAKAAVPVNGEALVRRIIQWLAHAGIRDQVLNLHHHPASIASLVGDGNDLDVRIRYSWEMPVLGSAGGPRHALPLVTGDGDDPFLIVNGDTLTNVDLGSLLARHRESGALVTMALIPNPRPDKYGGVSVTPDGWVTGFPRARRKPSPRLRANDANALRRASRTPSPEPRAPSPDTGYHFIGVQVASARVFADLPDGVPAESVRTIYPLLMSKNPKSVAAYVSNASFQDIGTPADYLATCLDLAETEGDRLAGTQAEISDSARVVRTVMWDDVSVAQGARLTDCVLGDRVRIPADAQFERCAIVPLEGRTPAAGERIAGHLLVRDL